MAIWLKMAATLRMRGIFGSRMADVYWRDRRPKVQVLSNLASHVPKN
jgi:hypothetical protein